jgi:hypothetical protein
MDNLIIESKVRKAFFNNVKGVESSFYTNEVSKIYISGGVFMPEGCFNYSDAVFYYDDDTDTQSNREIEDYIYNTIKHKLK